ncbi:MAG: hypothetical protein AAF358_11510 [Pseudomonadota bacterium]
MSIYGRRPAHRRGRDPRLTDSQERAFSKAMDKSFRESLRSDPGSIAVATTTMAVSYALVARAIIQGEIGLRYVVLPWVIEFLAIMWVGVILTRTWVREPVFRAISGSVRVALGWTIVLGLPFFVLLILKTGFDVTAMRSGVADAIGRLLSSGMAWACGAVLLGLVLDTQRDVAAWRREGGTFVWPATHRFGLRFAALLVMLFVGYFGLWLLLAISDAVGLELLPKSNSPAWLGWGFLLATDVLVLVGGVILHRHLGSQ